MSSMSDKQDLLREGVEWFKNNQDYLIELSYQQALTFSKENHRNLNDETARRIATDTVQNNFKRLQGQSLNPDVMKQNFYYAFKQSTVPFEQMREGVTLQKAVMLAAIKQALADRPEIYEVLAERINYISQIANAAMASALIQVQSEKMDKPKQT